MSERYVSGSPVSEATTRALERVNTIRMVLSTLPYILVEAGDDEDPQLVEKLIRDVLSELEIVDEVFGEGAVSNPPAGTPLRMAILDAWKAFSHTATKLSGVIVIPGLSMLRTGNFARGLAALNYRSDPSHGMKRPPTKTCTHCSSKAMFGTTVHGHDVGDCPFLASSIGTQWDLEPAGIGINEVLSCYLGNGGPVDSRYLYDYLELSLPREEEE